MTTERVERIGIDGETPEGQNNAYLVDGRVVVDPGPPSADAWDDLEAGLERVDVAPIDLEYVLVTHWHADHAGLAPRLAETADAALAMGADDAPLVADYAVERERRLERDGETMRRWASPRQPSTVSSAATLPRPCPTRRRSNDSRTATK